MRGLPQRRGGKVDEALNLIERSGARVKVNPKSAATRQEGNVTLDFGNGTRVNVRVEPIQFPALRGS